VGCGEGADVTGKPRPKVRIALVAYRDKGDQYVTKVHDLSDNIDQVYQDLMTFQATGGGDTPENVNQALHDAVNKVQWSPDRKTLKIIYLVGDCPPHNEYKDVPTYDKIAHQAITKGIYINTVLCGGNADARRVWTEIARAAEGAFVAIDQGGGVKEIPTPYDSDLAKLNGRLTETVVVYGDKRRREGLGGLARASAAMPKAAQAARAAYALRSGKAATGDLLDAVRDEKLDLDKAEKDKLPELQADQGPHRQAGAVPQGTARQDRRRQGRLRRPGPRRPEDPGRQERDIVQVGALMGARLVNRRGSGGRRRNGVDLVNRRGSGGRRRNGVE